MLLLLPVSFIAMTTTDMKKKSRWLKIEEEPTRNSNVSKFAPRPFECQMCGARRQSVRTRLSSSQLIFSVPSCSGAYIQLRYPVWGMRLQHDTEHNATLFAFCYCTINWMVLVWVLCFVRWRHRAWRWSEGQTLVTKHTGCSQSFSVRKQALRCLVLISVWNVIYLLLRLWLAGFTRRHCLWMPFLEPRHQLGWELKPEVFCDDHCQLISNTTGSKVFPVITAGICRAGDKFNLLVTRWTSSVWTQLCV